MLESGLLLSGKITIFTHSYIFYFVKTKITKRADTS